MSDEMSVPFKYDGGLKEIKRHQFSKEKTR